MREKRETRGFDGEGPVRSIRRAPGGPRESRALLRGLLLQGLVLLLVAAAGAVSINEIRIDDQTGAAIPDDPSEYFELYGLPGESLNGLTYVVIGDVNNESGRIDEVVPLGGQRIPTDRAFLVAGGNFNLPGVRDMTLNLNFEDSDNVTHLLVRGFTGRVGQGLDPDGDCTLDVRPWAAVVDGIALQEEGNRTECHYGEDLGLPILGPDSFSVPRHVRRTTDGDGAWVMSDRNTAAGLDSPGLPNGDPQQLPALQLRDGRFLVTAVWNDPRGNSGIANPVPLTSDTGYFWFFNESNVEVVIKVLDGCRPNDRFWVFAAGLTNVGVVISVDDTETGQVNVYTNTLGEPFQPLQDTDAFATCP